ncbi:hypothetical protein RHOSPDRAFT_32963 [Rhodotorula sp. JG-1b]|nr:hypothetical protein RHOSPDRAFT_32963 [Rhodotorula sp. JG-1b]
MAEDEELKRQRQSKALGAAFLAHQVSQLEQSVDTLAFSRDSRLYSRGGSRGGARGGNARGACRGGANAASGVHLDRQRPVRVIDPSALVHALPVLKRWIREDKYKLIVPLSALSTLDMLKRAPEPLHGQARDATRFLEGQLAIAHQIQSAFSPEHAEARIRLRAQTTAEEMPWPEVQRLFAIPPDWIVKLPEGVELPPGDEDGEEPAPLPLPTADDIPRHLRGALQCALYFASQRTPESSSASSPAASTVLFKSMIPTPAPLAAELARLVRATDSSQSGSSSSSPRKQSAPPPAPDFLAISSGDALAYYLDTFFPSVSQSTAYHSIPSTQVVAASAWLKQQAASRQQQSGGSSSRSRGGGGGGEGQSRGSTRGRSSSAQNQPARGRGGGGGGGGRRGAPDDGPARTLFAPT